MIAARTCFSHSYASARKRFFDAAQARGLQVESHKQRMPGRDKETLAMDVVLDGPPDADRLLVVSSGVHGVEGFCGSGIQVFSLQDEELRARAKERGVALLYIHAVNPYGFSHIVSERYCLLRGSSAGLRNNNFQPLHPKPKYQVSV